MDKVNQWFYPEGHPNRIARILNRTWASLFSTKLVPRNWVTLEVRGRRSGRVISFPVVVVESGQERYLVAMLGKQTNWVRNVKAAGGQAALRHGGREEVRLEEVAVDERAPILKRYLELAPGGRGHLPVDWRAPVEAFEGIAADFPVFRIIPA